MALARFGVQGYRSFAHETQIELRPVTLVFGYNSVGKSALLRVLPLLGASVSGGSTTPLSLSAPAARDASFGELLCQVTRSPIIVFELGWEDDTEPLQRVEIQLLNLPRFHQHAVEKFTAWFADREPLIVELAVDSETSEAPTSYSIEGVRVDVRFDGLCPSPLRPTDFDDRLAQIRRRLESLLSVAWLTCVRKPPPRRTALRGRPRQLDPDGGNATQVLAYDSLSQGHLLRDVSSWYERATNHRLDIARHGGGPEEQFSVVLSPADAPVQVHIADTGEGMSQVLPVIALGALAKLHRAGPSPVLCLEQPELHLHPRAHEDVAEFLCDIVKEAPETRLLVETHSENVLLRLQLALIRGELPRDHLIVYWVRQLPNGESVVEPITFDELARPEGDRWPPGVFSEDVEQARALAAERRKRRGF